MQNGLNPADANPPVPLPERPERKIVFLLCCLAAVHVFVFSAAVPFFSNVDEQIHFDLTVKYSQGHIPGSLETLSAETVFYPVVFGSHEFLWPSNDFPTEKFPPPWAQPVEKVSAGLLADEARWREIKNYEASQPPLYYCLAGVWWRLGKVCGFHDGHLLYWLRFLNMLIVAALVWMGFAAARLIFPENRFLQLGVPALLAFLPQSAFYSIQNDVMSPLCFGAAFFCLLRWWYAEIPGARLEPPPDWRWRQPS